MKGIIVTAEIDCKCHNPSTVICSDGKYYCKRCRTPIEYLIRGEKESSNGFLKKSIYLTVDNITGLFTDVAPKTVTKNPDLNNRDPKYPGDFGKKKDFSGDRKDLQYNDLGKKDGKKNHTAETAANIRFGDEVLRMKKEYEISLRELESRNKELEYRNRELECRNEEIKAVADEYEFKAKDLQSKLSESKKNADDLHSQLGRWKKSHSAMVQNLEVLKDEKDSLEGTVRHYRSETDRLKTISVKDVTTYLLDYMTTVYNASFDSKSYDGLKSTIQARTEYSIMMLESAGVKISHHDRDSVLQSGRADVEFRKTDVKEDDCKVIRTELFGCEFRDDVFSSIPEKVTVYRYEEPEVVAENTSDVSSEDSVTVCSCGRPCFVDIKLLGPGEVQENNTGKSPSETVSDGNSTQDDVCDISGGKSSDEESGGQNTD